MPSSQISRVFWRVPTPIRLLGGLGLLALLALAGSAAEGTVASVQQLAAGAPWGRQTTGGSLIVPGSSVARQVEAPAPPTPVPPTVPTSSAALASEASSADYWRPQEAAAAATSTQPSGPPEADPGLPPWAANLRETGLWSGPSGGVLFTRVPQGETFRVLERQAGRFRVFYPGDRRARAAGEAWIDAGDLSAATWPRWVRLRGPGEILAAPSADGAVLAILQPGDYLEVVQEARGAWASAFYPGDGRRPAVEGWIEVGPVAPIPDPSVAAWFALSREMLAAGVPSPWLKVPYRSQLDGTRYAGANCGPTTANMVLEAFGLEVQQPDLRREVLALQPAEDCDDCGTYIQNLAEVIARRGLKIGKLRDGDPRAFHRWTLEEVRAELGAGRPVIAQVYYRGLPGRETANYYGDHYIVLTGLLGDRFLYNDSIDSEGPGYSRLIPPRTLDDAMRDSDFPYAAFSVGR